MKNILAFLFVLMSITCFSQNQDLKMEKGRFLINGDRSTLREFVEVMRPNPEAYDLALKAKSGYSAGSVVGFIGGFMIGWPIGTALGGGDPNWTLAGVGAAVVAVAIPIMSSATKKMDQALDIYGNSSSAQTSKLDLKLMPTKVGLVYSF
ncbi:MAG: hypothetical protein ABJG47_15470 [Ekhidna sp.]